MKKYYPYIRNRIAVSFLFLAFSIVSCNKFVDPGLPLGSITADAIFKDSNSLVAALNGVYASTASNSAFTYPSLFADELTSPSSQDFYSQTNTYTQDQDYGFFNNYYSAIYQANVILQGIDKTTGIPAATVNQVKGETLFLRAFCYFQLVNYYGTPPLILTPDYSVSGTMGNTPSATIYQSIIADLKTAASLISNTYAVGDRTRANLQTVNTLLAKVYLYNKDWANAESYATAVITSGLYSLPSDLNSVLLSNSNEIIWQFWNQNGYAIGATYLPSASGTFTYTVRPSLVGSFETGDLRKTNWLQAGTGANVNNYYPYKWKLRVTTSGKMEYLIQFRLAEVYLIRAEARAQQNNISGGLADVQLIRNRAGLTVPVTAASSSALLDIIASERRKELMFEAGNRWFDLIRTGQAITVLSPLKPGFNEHVLLLPFPKTAVLNNPNLVQNKGY